MVALVRGGGSKATKTRARASAKVPPGKFNAAAQGRGLSPKAALMGAGGAVLLAAGVALFTGDRLEKTTEAISLAFANRMGAAGFAVTSFKIKGATPEASAAIVEAAGIRREHPILAVDLPDLQKRIEAVGWVEKAKVMRLLPNTLLVEVVERPPAAVWQAGGVMRVIDKNGKVIPEADPSTFPRLPLLVGAGANDTGAAVLDLVRERPRLAQRLEALVRVDDRRWDLRLKDGTLIQLPAVGEESAMIALDVLDQRQQVLDLGLERIDLRSPDMVVVRRREGPVSAGIVAGGV